MKRPALARGALAFAVALLAVIHAPAIAEESPSVPAATETQSTVDLKPQPYAPEEFPQWARDLRRAEIIAFGSLPFTIFFVKTAIDTYRYAYYDWDRAYAPWPLKTAGAIEMDEDQRIAALVAACFSSVAFALVDHVIVRIKRNSRQRESESRLPPKVTTDRRGWPPEVELPAPPGDAPRPEGDAAGPAGDAITEDR